MSVQKTTLKSLILLWCLLFTATMFVYGGRIVGIDTQATFATSATLAEHGRWDMNINASAVWSQTGIGAQGIIGVDGNVYTKKSPLAAIVHVPATWLGGRFPLFNPTQAALLTIPIIFAFTGILIVKVCERLNLSSRLAITGALWWAFGTYALANTTEIFAEPIMASGVLLAVYGVLDAKERYRDALIAGIGCAIVLLGNLASGLLLPLIGLKLLLPLNLSRRKLLCLLLFAMPIFGAMFAITAFNALRTGQWLTTGYTVGNDGGFSTPLWVGLSGMIITPYRGILWYAPISWLTLYGWWIRRKQSAANLLLALIVAQLIPYSLWWDWAGGLVWGPRFLLPVLPLIVILALPALDGLWNARRGKIVIGILAAFSLFIQIAGTLMHYGLYEIYIRQTYPAEVSHYIIGMQDYVVIQPQYSPILANLRYLLTERWWVVWATTPDFWWVGVTIGCGLLVIVGIWRYETIRWRVLIALAIALYSGIIAPYAATSRYSNRRQPLFQNLFIENARSDDVAIENDSSANMFLDVSARPYTLNIIDTVSEDDPLAQSLLAHAESYSRIWFMTENPTANWIEARLWAQYFIGQNQYYEDTRVLLVDTRQPDMTTQDIHVSFGTITLERIAIALSDNTVYVAVDWSGEIPDGATMFMHLLTDDNQIIAQHDRLPLNGIRPVADGITDKHMFPLDNNQPSGNLQLRVGWVDANGNFIKAGDDDFLLFDIE